MKASLGVSVGRKEDKAVKKIFVFIVLSALLVFAAVSAANAEWRESGGTWRFYDDEGRQVTNFHSYGDLYIPPEVTHIQRTMLMGISRRFVICCEPGSYAERFAKQYGFQYDNGQKRAVGTGITNVDEKVKFIIDNYIRDNYTGGPLTDRQKVTVLYDWLMTNVAYDYQNGTWALTGALIRGQGVCSSYASAYKKLLDNLGIPNMIMNMPETVRDGWVIDPGHAWNLVYVDGRWSHVDVTWHENTDLVDPNDPYLTTGHESYACLFLSDNAIRPIYNNGLRRTWDENIVPDEGKIGFYSTASGTGYFMGRRYAGEWLENNGMLYYFAEDGFTPPNGVHEVEGKRYLFVSGQAVRTGWVHLAENGGYAMFSGQPDRYILNGETMYYTGADGVLAEGLTQLDNRTFFFGEDGTPVTGWLKINGSINFFGPDMFADETVRIDGKDYTFGSEGELVSDPPEEEIRAVEIVDPRESIRGFITRCYEIILGREPDAGGLKTWYNELNSGRKSASEIIDRFVNSKEFLGKNYSPEDAVDILYRTMLGRNADPAGKANWVSKLENGQTLANVINGFCFSREFRGLCDSYGIRAGFVNIENTDTTPEGKIKAFVQRCYRIILDREADPNGMQTWYEQLSSGKKAAAEIIDRFVNSPEFSGKRYNPNDSVEILYKAMLGRGSDAAGKANWVNKLNFGQPFAVVINGFCVSKEFTGICAAYGIRPGSVNVQLSGMAEEEALSKLAYEAKEPIVRRSETNPNRVEIINPSDTIDLNIGTAMQAIYINEEKAKEFIGRCYRVILGREASEAEVETWIGQMVNGTKSPDQIARGFLFSNEFKAKNINNEALVKILYKVYMNRDADPDGLKTWTEKLDNGTALKDLLDTFAKTGEFKKVVNEMSK